MASSSTLPGSADVSTLAWVLEELRKSLDSANKSLRRFLRESAANSASDVDDVEPAILRGAKQQIHQGVGVLELVGLSEGAMLLRASEALVQRFVAKPQRVDEAGVDAVEKASFALLDYVGRRVAGRDISPVALFPQLRTLLELSAAERVHPADLWNHDWRWRDVPADPAARPMTAGAAELSAFENALLQQMRRPVAAVAQTLSDECAGLALTAPGRQAVTLWRIAAAFFEAWSLELLPADVFVKRMGSRVLAQLRSQVKGHGEVSERLALDLLFFCAGARPRADQVAPRLAAVQAAYGLTEPPADYAEVRLGRFDPARVTQARKRVAAAKDTWGAVAAGEAHRLASLNEQFALVGDSLRTLFPLGEWLAQSLSEAVGQVVQAGTPPGPELAMEVATSVLYVEAALEEGEFNAPDQGERVQRMATRIDRVRGGAPAEALEGWMEELYRRVSDRETMGSVVQELRASLGEVEREVDLFFRNTGDRTVLIPVPNQLASMRGVLSVLGMDPAVQAVLRMRQDVESLIGTEVDPQRAAESGIFDRLATNLGALGFLFDMLNVQPHLAKTLFHFDADTGILSPLMGRQASTPELGPAAAAPLLVDRAQAVAEAVQDTRVSVESITLELREMSKQALVNDQPELAASVSAAQVALEQLQQPGAGARSEAAARGEVVRAMADFVATASGPIGLDALGPMGTPSRPMPLMPAPAAAVEATGLEEDDEMREIFLEEAREVIDGARQSLAELASAPEDMGALTTVRRAFHTLKGSSRMVGLKDYGDAGWAFEQLYNTWLADQKPADERLRSLTRDALDFFAGWAGQIAARVPITYASAPAIAAADALRLEGRLQPIGGAGAAQPAVAPPVAEVAAVAPAMPVAPPTMPLTAPVEAPLESPVAELEAGTADLPDVQLVMPPVAETPLIPAVEVSEMPASDTTLAAFDAARAPGLPTSGAVPLDDAELPLLDEPVAPAHAAPPPLEFDFDLDLKAPSTADASPEATAEPAPLSAQRQGAELSGAELSAAPASPADALSDWGTDLTLPVGEVPEVAPTEVPAKNLPAFAAEPQWPDATDSTRVALDAGQPAAGAAAEPNPDESEAPPALEDSSSAVDEQVKQIGPLRIAIPLFNIYLSEADELSRRLNTELAEWAMELHRPVGETAVSLAHSLAGSSATVGFDALSHLSRQLEHALTRANAIDARGSDDAHLFVDVSEEIRRLLHQFAAGFLRAPHEGLVDRLHAWELSTAARAMPLGDTVIGDSAEGIEAIDALEAAQDIEPVSTPEEAAADVDLELQAAPTQGELPRAAQPIASPIASPIAPPVFEPPPEALNTDLVAFSGTSFQTLPATAFADLGTPDYKPLAPIQEAAGGGAHPLSASAADLDEDVIDVQDQVDLELFPIFDEEAQELIPVLQSQLRDWTADPSRRAAGTGCMRTLHTFKGGARLAGAMRLGELAHRMETAIERLLAREDVKAADLEPLQVRADQLASAFEALRQRDQQAYAEATSGWGALAETQAAREAETLVAQPVPLIDATLPTLNAAAGRPAAAANDAAVPGAAFPPAMPAASATPVAPAASAGPAPAAAPVPAGADGEIDWTRFAAEAAADTNAPAADRAAAANAVVRVRANLLDRLVNGAGEVSISRARLQSGVGQIRSSIRDLTDNLERLRAQLRDIELQAETQMASRLEAAKAASKEFDPLEFDRFTRFQEVTRMMAESVNDVASVQRALQRTLDTTEDELAAQARQTRELQGDLLRTRMVEFESLAERLYRVVRQAGKETGKQVRMDIVGGSIDVDRGVLERMTPAFEHLLRNAVAHGIETPAERQAAGKDPVGHLVVSLAQEGNEVSVEFRDDGAGIDLPRIRQRAIDRGLLPADAMPADAELVNFIFHAGFTTADQVTELAGRGVGMDVVRAEVSAIGGRIETGSAPGRGTSFKLVLPLTTVVTQVVMVRAGSVSVALPANLIEIVRRAKPAEVDGAHARGVFDHGGQNLPFFWLGALLQLGLRSAEPPPRSLSIVVLRSAQQRVAVHVDEVLGNQEVVVKNLGPQLSRVPGLAGMTLLPSGAVALIYNPVALAAVYGAAVQAAARRVALGEVVPAQPVLPAVAPVPQMPLVLVVDDSLTVRRVTQRLLAREGYRVALAKDGLEALELLAEERPAVVLSDIEMPRMDGFDLLRNIRGDAALKGLPVVMITSRIAQKHRDYAAELGADHYLGKPYSEEELLSLVRHHAPALTATEQAP